MLWRGKKFNISKKANQVMAQGNKKNTAKPLPNSKTKKVKNNSAFKKRKSAPVKKKVVGKLKLQEAITKTVNHKNETEIKSRAFTSSSQTHSKAQKAVEKHHQAKQNASDNNC